MITIEDYNYLKIWIKELEKENAKLKKELFDKTVITHDKIKHLMKCGALQSINTGRLDAKCEAVIPLEDAIAIIDSVYNGVESEAKD